MLLTHHAVMDKDKEISPEKFVVALMRKSKPSNSQHAFIVMQGMNSFGKNLLRRYDLVNSKIKNDKGHDLAEIEWFPEDNRFGDDDAKNIGWYQCNEDEVEELFKSRILFNLKEGQNYYTCAWTITPAQAQILHENILKSRETPPLYHISGDEASGPKSKGMSNAHSCFTWARWQLNQLDGIEIKSKAFDWIVAVTSFTIAKKVSEEEPSTGCRIL